MASNEGIFQTGATLNAPTVAGDPDGDASDPNYTYQWYFNGEEITGATSSVYEVPGEAAGLYTVDITYTDAAGNQSTIRAAEQNVESAPPPGGYSLPNGVVVNNNIITGTAADERFYIDNYVDYLSVNSKTITVLGKGGDDTIDSGNVLLNGAGLYPSGTLVTAILDGGEGNDNFVGRTGGTTEFNGGEGYDSLLTDNGLFITTRMSLSIVDGKVVFEREDDGRSGYTKFIISSDVEILSDFGGNYLVVSDLLNGVIRYLDSDEASLYRQSWENGAPEVPDSAVVLPEAPEGGVILPNGVTIVDNIITGTAENDQFWLDYYVDYLLGTITTITAFGEDGDDTFDSGNVLLNGAGLYPAGTLPSVIFYGGAGNDNFVGRTGGTTEVYGGDGYDELLTDSGLFITTRMDYSVIDGKVVFERAEDGRTGYAKYVINSDIEIIRDFGDNYLVISDLLNGVIRYLDSDQANLYRQSWESGAPEVPDSAVVLPDPPDGGIILPNGLTVVNNTVTGTFKDNRFWLDDYIDYLSESDTTITVFGEDGDDEFDSGNVMLNGAGFYPSGTQATAIFYGGNGNDFFVGRTGGTTNVYGGNGFDELLTDGDLFIASQMTIEVSGDTLILETQGASNNEYVRYVIHSDVELIKDFGGNYLKVSDLFNGVVRYVDSQEASFYRDSWSTGTIGSITASVPGLYQEGDSLLAPAIMNDPDGLTGDLRLSYQWFKDKREIIDATDSSYQVPVGGGGTYSVRITYTDDTGIRQAIESEVVEVLPSSTEVGVTGAITTDGDFIEGATLIAPTVSNDPNGDAENPEYEYQWFLNGVALNSASDSSYQSSSTGTGLYQVAITYSDAAGNRDTVYSLEQDVARVDNGSGQVEQIISSQPGLYEAGVVLYAPIITDDPEGVDESIDYTYQWYRDQSAVSGATESTYQTDLIDWGAALWVEITYQDRQGYIRTIASESTPSITGIEPNLLSDDGAQQSFTIGGFTEESDQIAYIGGDDYYQGREGYDILDLSLNREDVTVVSDGFGVYYVTTPLGNITLVDFEQVSFLDDRVALVDPPSKGIIDDGLHQGFIIDMFSEGDDIIAYAGGTDYYQGKEGYDIFSARYLNSEITLDDNGAGIYYVSTPNGMVTLADFEQISLIDIQIILNDPSSKGIVDDGLHQGFMIDMLTEGDDIVAYAGGNDFYQGKGGEDIFSAAFSIQDVEIKKNTVGIYYIATPTGTVTLAGFERVILNDFDLQLASSPGIAVIDDGNYSANAGGGRLLSGTNEIVAYAGGDDIYQGGGGYDIFTTTYLESETSLTIVSDREKVLTTPESTVTLFDFAEIRFGDEIVGALDGFSAISGSIRTWNGQLLGGTRLQLTPETLDASTDGIVQIRTVADDLTNGMRTLALWVESGSTGFSNFNFEILKAGDANFNIQLNSELFSDTWITSSNDNLDSYRISSIFSGIGAGVSGTVKIADITITIPDPLLGSTTPSLVAGGLVGSTALKGINLAVPELTVVSNTGTIEASLPWAESSRVNVSRDPLTGIEQLAINSADALMALRMSTGVINSSDLVNQAQWMAADVDQNGFVQAKDAWMINEYTVGNQPAASSEVGTWEFIDSSTSLNDLSAVNASTPQPSIVTSPGIGSSQQQLDVTAILNGDIDGSYVPI
jgi:hypothetical protein